MTLFRYKAVTVSGVMVSGRIEAASEADVIRYIRKEGHYPVQARPAGWTNWLAAQAFFRRRQVSMGAIALVTQAAADLLDAGLDLDQTMGVLIKLKDSKNLKEALVTARAAIRDGQSFADAIGQEAVFPGYYVALVRAGELGGTLALTLRQLAHYLGRASATRDAIFSALIYPIVLLVSAALSICFILGFVIPSFAPLFATVGQPLPLPTRIALGLSLFVRNYWWTVPLAAIPALFWSRSRLSRPQTRRRLHRALAEVPLAGPLWIDMELERFKRILGTLVKSGVPLPSALRYSSDVLNNLELRAVVNGAATSLREGDSLARLLARSPLFPSTTLDLVRIGEMTGRLDEVLVHQADLDEARIRQQVDRLIAILVPALTIVLGLIIAGLIASMLVALLSANNLAFQ